MAADLHFAQPQVHVGDRFAPEFDYEFAHGLSIFRYWWFNIKRYRTCALFYDTKGNGYIQASASRADAFEKYD